MVISGVNQPDFVTCENRMSILGDAGLQTVVGIESISYSTTTENIGDFSQA